MNKFMKLFAIFLFIQIQIALSQPNIIQQLCKRNRFNPYASLLSILILEAKPQIPRACVDLYRCDDKENERNVNLSYLRLRGIGGGREDYEKYGTCIDQDYGASVDRYLPAALANLKAKKYSAAIANLQSVVGRRVIVRTSSPDVVHY
ncbi:Plant invertase/pectin methylesterase inhibitor superfamily protein [Raphanus sativus]|nr:Plant invertase/pectin methylesterase inhibitor superfamily protein [Raphanus sativus]